MSGFVLHTHDTLDSTSEEARRMAAQGAPDGTVVHARRQTAGRGRQGRTWASAEGNLYVSFVLRPDIAAARSAELGFVAAVATARMAGPYLSAHRPLTLKWPNDVLAGGAKLAGILTERVDDAVVVGIGLNVRHAPADLPYPATCLAAEGSALDVPEALARLMDAMAGTLELWRRDGFAAIRAAWLARGPEPGTSLRVRGGAGLLTGRFAGLDLDGALLLATDAGTRRIVAGDVA